MTALDGMPLQQPGRSHGLFGVWRHRYLLRLLVKKETGLRYRGSLLGWAWSYVKPLAQFAVLYLAMGEFLGLNKSMPAFPVYLFSGLVLTNFFSEALNNATTSIVANAPLIKKIYLPRELFPLASVLVSFVNFFPQLIILLGACMFLGWHPSIVQLLAIPLAILSVAIFATGLGLAFSAINVAFRDAQNVVEVFLMFTMWLSPVFYHMDAVQNALPGWAFTIYQLNPITGALGAFHLATWFPTTSMGAQELTVLGPGALTFGVISLVVSTAFLLVGQFIFRKLEGNFAQDL